MGESQSGGGVDTDAGVSGTTGTQDSSYSPPSYSSLGQSPGAMGGRPDPTPAPNVQPSFTYEAPVITTDPERDSGRSGLFSFFSPKVEAGTSYYDPGQFSQPLGSGPVNQFTQGLASLTGGGGGGSGDGPSLSAQESPGYQPDPTTYANVPESINQTRIRDLYRQDSPSLGGAKFGSPEQQAYGSGRMFPANVGFTSPSAPTVDQTSPSNFVGTQDFPPLGGTGVTPQDVIFQRASRAFDEPDPGAIVGPLRTTGGDPLLFQDSRIMGMSPGAMGGRAPSYGMSPGAMGGLAPDLTTRPSGALAQVALPAGRPSDAVMLAAAAKNPTSEKDFSFREFLGNLIKSGASKVKSVGAFISGLSPEKLQEYAEQFLAGGANQKASTAGIDPFAQRGMGPGPFVGGGVPSPSGGGGMAAPAKDPCPPGFRFDPTLQQCVPIIAPNTPTSPTTPTATPTTPATGVTPPAAGGIANAYPFTLTPPIGAPVGNLPPVRLTT